MKNDTIKKRILIADDEEKIRCFLFDFLTNEGHEVEIAKDGIESIEKLEKFKPHLVLLNPQIPRVDGFEILSVILKKVPNAIIVVITSIGSIQSAVKTMQLGAYDYLVKPFEKEQLLVVIKKALEIIIVKEDIKYSSQPIIKSYGIDTIIGEDLRMKKIREQIKHFAQFDSNVLIEGESGTGKELVANALHYESKRKNSNFIIIDCATIPANLMESALFGHEKGSFTDARERRIGKFEEANKGTVFLDEIEEIPLDLQSKLLRVIQEREFTRVGGNTPIHVDIRIIAATNKDLSLMVDKEKFRKDLFYRLNILNIYLPPLREHPEDIELYANHFIKKYSGSYGGHVKGITKSALKLMKKNNWIGNVRELENSIQKAILSSRDMYINVEDLGFLKKSSIKYLPEKGLEYYTKKIVNETEREIILKTLNETNWLRSEAAKRLKISRRTLFTKIRELKIDERR
jgi:two-component system, NtrC family, response regulator AtoC